jgi:hypothetical protein
MAELALDIFLRICQMPSGCGKSEAHTMLRSPISASSYRALDNNFNKCNSCT